MVADVPTHTFFLVPSANHAVQGERSLLVAGVACRLIPVPRDISSQCGVCLCVAYGEGESAGRILRAAGVAVEAVHNKVMSAHVSST